MKHSSKKSLPDILSYYLRHRPLFLSLIRAKEAFLFQDFLPLAHPILDVGCGDGFFAKIAFTKNTKYEIRNTKQSEHIDIGLDLEGSRIDQAKQQHIYHKLVTYDGVNIPFPKNHFKTVVSNCVLEHVDKLPLVVGDIHRALAPGGRFLTTVMAAPWEQYLFGALFLGDAYRRWMRKKQVHQNLLNAHEWDRLFEKAGFRIEKRMGYLAPAACRLIDCAHYLSLPSLFTYILFKQWVVVPSLTTVVYPTKILSNILAEKVQTENSGAIFYSLQKK